MSSAAQRELRRQEVEQAYVLQRNAAVWGALKFTTFGLSLAFIGHHTWPFFRRQTLAFKGFLVSGFTIWGLVVGADTALLRHEEKKRVADAALRREARIALASRGLVGTEGEIAKWKAEKEKETNPT